MQASRTICRRSGGRRAASSSSSTSSTNMMSASSIREPLPAEGRAQPATLDPATEDEVKSLKPGAPVAAVGFPIEGMTASMVVEHAPATLHFGNISSLTDVFMCRADDAKDQLLIQHTVPVTGGMSGSPLVDGSGKVVGIVSGGNTDNFVTEVTVPKGGDQAGNTTASARTNLKSTRCASRAPRWSILPSASICWRPSRVARSISPPSGAIGTKLPERFKKRVR